MRMKKRESTSVRILAGVCACLCVLPLRAQDEGPYAFYASREAIFLTYGAAANAAGYFLTLQMEPPDPAALDAERINAFDRFAVSCQSRSAAVASDITLVAAAALPLIPALTAGSSRKNREALILLLESYVLTNGITTLIKGVAHRARPYSYRPDRPKLDKNAAQSFISGHASMSFAGAVAAGLLMHDLQRGSPWEAPVWGAGISIALATGIFRVTSGNHFPTDVIAGAITGSLVSYFLIRAH